MKSLILVANKQKVKLKKKKKTEKRILKLGCDLYGEFG